MQTLPHDETGSRAPGPANTPRLNVAFDEGTESKVNIRWTRPKPSPVAVGHVLCDSLRPPGTATVTLTRFTRVPTARPAVTRWPGLPLES